MQLERLASEIDETGRQTGALVASITEALAALSDESMSPQAAKAETVLRIVIALQGQDRIEQRCRALADVVRRGSQLGANASTSDYDSLWNDISLEELKFGRGELPVSHGGMVELF